MARKPRESIDTLIDGHVWLRKKATLLAKRTRPTSKVGSPTASETTDLFNLTAAELEDLLSDEHDR